MLVLPIQLLVFREDIHVEPAPGRIKQKIHKFPLLDEFGGFDTALARVDGRLGYVRVRRIFSARLCVQCTRDENDEQGEQE